MTHQGRDGVGSASLGQDLTFSKFRFTIVALHLLRCAFTIMRSTRYESVAQRIIASSHHLPRARTGDNLLGKKMFKAFWK